MLARVILFVLLTSLASCGRDTVYRMPDGAVCDYRSRTDAGTEFYGCSNGERYLNPSGYAEIRK